MKKRVTDFGKSVRARLLAIANREHIQLEYLLLRYAIERFLYRLGESPYANQFVLKGASVFAVWLGPFCRVTRDVDVEALGDATPSTLIRLFKEICTVDYPEDGVTFDLDSFTSEEIKKEDKYPGSRLRFLAFVGGARVSLQFDIGVGDSIYPHAENIHYPTLLPHAAPTLKAYPRYTVVAEKFSTMLLRGMLNSRVKDYYDIWLLSESFEFDGQILHEAITRTFIRRQVDIPSTFPDSLSSVFATEPKRATQWKSFIRAIGHAKTPATFDDAIRQLQTFLAPFIFKAPIQNLTWSPVLHKWHLPPEDRAYCAQ